MKIKLTLFLFLAFLVGVQGQTLVEGTVKDKKGEPIIAANIGIQDSFDGTSSDVDGNFSFEAYDEGTFNLLVSSLGYKPQTIELNLDGTPKKLDIVLDAAISELDAVVISAGAFEASDKKKAVVLNPIDIVTTAGALGDIAGALNTLPGTQRVGEEGRLFVRGGAAYETRTFVDGMAVQNPYTSSLPNVPARGRFSPFLFKGTVFSTGGYSAEYGQALSSALLLESQDIADKTLTSIALMTVGGSVSHTQRWENSSLSATGNYFNLGPYLALVPQNIDWERPPQGTTGQVIYRKKTSETGVFKVFTNAEHNTFGMLYPDPESNLEPKRLDLTNNHYNVQLGYSEVLGDNWFMRVGAVFHQNKDFIQQDFVVDQREHTIQTRATVGYQPSEVFGLKFGGEYWYNNFDENFTPDGQPVFNTLLEEHLKAGYAEASISLDRKFAARFGVRAEHSHLLDNASLAPRISLAYKTGKKSQVSFAFGEFYQTPENDWLRFNSNLNFERATHYMLNYQILKDKYTFRIEGYYKKYHDLVKYPLAEPWFSDNSGNGHASGIDIFFRDRKTINNGDYWISYSYLNTERNFLDFPEPGVPRFASPHNLSLVYKHWIPKWTTFFGFTYSFSSPRTYDDPNTVMFNDRMTDPFHDLSFNASYLTQMFGQFTVVFVSASNVLGLNQSFGEQFASTPDANGDFPSITIRPPAKNFFLVGLFISIGQDPVSREEAVN